MRLGPAVLAAALILAGGMRARADPPAGPPPAPAAPSAPSEPAARAPDVEMFSRQGCRHCAAAKAWLVGLAKERPALVVVVRDVNEEEGALERLERLAREADVAAMATPAFFVRGRLVVGWADAESTGTYLLALLEGKGGAGEGGEGCPPAPKEPCDEEAPRETVTLPLVGRVAAEDVGLPLFTVVVGLVDGFNPCAMWVLVFLLSLLVNLRSRSRMLAVAGTFVVVSGLVYFAFMAAWLNVFLLVGMTRAIQAVLGVVALAAGAIHVKDFFAFHRGVTLSIPERAKPGIYARVNRVVTAQNLGGAIGAVAALAFLVNVVELLCTAGLPAVYAQVLSTHDLVPWQRYAYLALYQVFYMFDDALMLAIAVWTLSKRRLTERSGRVLKLVSGLVMLALGALLLLKPEWLRFS